MKWIGILLLLILDMAGGWLMWVDKQADWGRKPGREESFLMLPLEWNEKTVDEKEVEALLKVEWKLLLPEIL